MRSINIILQSPMLPHESDLSRTDAQRQLRVLLAQQSKQRQQKKQQQQLQQDEANKLVMKSPTSPHWPPGMSDKSPVHG